MKRIIQLNIFGEEEIVYPPRKKRIKKADAV